MTPVALGLGSNKKFSCLSPEEILGGAIFELSKILHNIEISSVYRTKAMYVVDQEDFYNMSLVGLLDDGICARALLEKIHEIEAAFGRDREKEIRFGPRSLDIDIEFFGRQKILEPDLQIPHPRLKERAFVLTPLLEVLDKLESKEAASHIISSHATVWNADNIKGEIFCFGRDEISAALFSLGEKDGGVEKIIRAQDFLPFIKSRLQDERSSR
ncbi:MAG: 2-amino-4-hydroxy-6-hydroxymethyldihydropteridine diphosphokinase [Treponema sp.]|nr:2-amino-4-hydroxy-6-hydroxymethyldihydropteridine diphosphokinase [Treponema sp.]